MAGRGGEGRVFLHAKHAAVRARAALKAAGLLPSGATLAEAVSQDSLKRRRPHAHAEYDDESARRQAWRGVRLRAAGSGQARCMASACFTWMPGGLVCAAAGATAQQAARAAAKASRPAMLLCCLMFAAAAVLLLRSNSGGSGRSQVGGSSRGGGKGT